MEQYQAGQQKKAKQMPYQPPATTNNIYQLTTPMNLDANFPMRAINQAQQMAYMQQLQQTMLRSNPDMYQMQLMRQQMYQRALQQAKLRQPKEKAKTPQQQQAWMPPVVPSANPYQMLLPNITSLASATKPMPARTPTLPTPVLPKVVRRPEPSLVNHPPYEDFRVVKQAPKDDWEMKKTASLIGNWNGLGEDKFKITFSKGRINVTGTYTGYIVKCAAGFQMSMLKDIWTLDGKKSNLDKIHWINTNLTSPFRKVSWTRVPEINFEDLLGYWQGLGGTWFAVTAWQAKMHHVVALDRSGKPEEEGQKMFMRKRQRISLKCFGDEYKLMSRSTKNQALWKNTNSGSAYQNVLWRRLIQLDDSKEIEDEKTEIEIAGSPEPVPNLFNPRQPAHASSRSRPSLKVEKEQPGDRSRSPGAGVGMPEWLTTNKRKNRSQKRQLKDEQSIDQGEAHRKYAESARKRHATSPRHSPIPKRPKLKNDTVVNCGSILSSQPSPMTIISKYPITTKHNELVEGKWHRGLEEIVIKQGSEGRGLKINGPNWSSLMVPSFDADVDKHSWTVKAYGCDFKVRISSCSTKLLWQNVNAYMPLRELTFVRMKDSSEEKMENEIETRASSIQNKTFEMIQEQREKSTEMTYNRLSNALKPERLGKGNTWDERNLKHLFSTPSPSCRDEKSICTEEPEFEKPLTAETGLGDPLLLKQPSVTATF